MESGIQKIPLELIDRDETQPRTDFDEEGLQELAKSIETNGLLVPISLRKTDGRFIIMAGERRFRAVQMLGWTEIPAIVHEVSFNGFRKLQLLENVVRKPLNPIELARAFKQMLDESMTDEEIAHSIGKQLSYIHWLVSILNCKDQALHLIAKGQLPVWVGWHLARLSDNGQFRALRTFQMLKLSAAEQVAICERIYAEEHQIKMLDVVPLTSTESKVLRAFEVGFTRLYREFGRLMKLDKVKPGSAGGVKLLRAHIKEMESKFRWLDKILMRK